MNNKKIIYSLLFAGTFLILLIFAFDIQIQSDNKYSEQILSSLISTEYSQPQRGRIIDSNGVLLATGKTFYQVYLKDNSTESREQAKSAALSVDEPSPLIEGIISKIDEEVKDSLLLDNIDSDELALNKTFFEKNPYFELKQRYKREYLAPVAFSQIIGYVGQADTNDLTDDYYAPGDTIGKYKLEYDLESYLRGIKQKDSIIDGVKIIQEGSRGDDVSLTIDSNWQNSLYSILQLHVEKNNAVGGAGVIMDVDTGDVKALVSYPGFDTNLFANGISQEDYDELLNDPSQPLLDKATGLLAAPGSTFKLVDSYNLLENAVVDENTQYFSNRCIDIGGFNFCEYGQLFYGQMNIIRALYMSSNLYFCNFTLQQNNIDALVNSAKLFGFNYKTGINLSGEALSRVDSPADSGSWFDGNTCNATIGQGETLATPIEMATIPMTIYNKGKVLTPNVIKSVTDPDGKVVMQSSTKVKSEFSMSDQTRNIILEGMTEVVRNPESALYNIFKDIPNNIQAKTGTAEATRIVDGKAVDDVHGWIVGLFEFEGHKYSFAIHLNHGGGGYYTSFVLSDFLQCINSNFKSLACNGL